MEKETLKTSRTINFMRNGESLINAFFIPLKKRHCKKGTHVLFGNYGPARILHYNKKKDLVYAKMIISIGHIKHVLESRDKFRLLERPDTIHEKVCVFFDKVVDRFHNAYKNIRMSDAERAYYRIISNKVTNQNK